MQTTTVRHPDGTVDTQQRAPGTARLDAASLERLYWKAIRRQTFGLVRFSRDSIRVLGVPPALLRFGPLIEGRRAIVGGLFARRSGGSIAWGADGEHVWVTVEGFAPLLRGPFWRAETWFHDRVGSRFLADAARLPG